MGNLETSVVIDSDATVITDNAAVDVVGGNIESVGPVIEGSESVGPVIECSEPVDHVIEDGDSVAQVISEGSESVDPILEVMNETTEVITEVVNVAKVVNKEVVVDVVGGVNENSEMKDAEDVQPALVPELPCCVCGSTENVRCCGRCKATRYCSKDCQESHYQYHEVYCKAIQDLEKYEKDRIYSGATVREKQLDFWKHSKIVKLVGRKPILRCYLGGKQMDVLWDTGAMISMVSRRWLKRHFPDLAILPVSEFLEGEKLTIRAANRGKIPYDGVVVLNFTLNEGDEGFFVPVLVTSQELSEPIIGYNVVEHLVISGSEEDRCKLQACLISNKPLENNWEPLIALIEKQASSPDFLGEIKASDFLEVPAGCKVRMRCRVKAQGNDDEQTVYFSPRIPEGDSELEFNESISRLKRGKTNYVYVDVINSSRMNRTVKKGEVIGSIHSVSAVIPMTRPFEVSPPKMQEAVVNSIEEDCEENAEDWMPEVDLSHLDEDQRKVMLDMLGEVKGVFSRSESDIGDIKDFEMSIQLTDNIPVKEAYRKIPRHMYAEVKNYIDDLITNGWVRESCSSYSSPIVCVRKKDGGMRLCIDYRKLNNKTVADAQPIPRIQDILDSLGGKQWFTTMDMSKAYHQGYVAEESRHLTAFSTPWTLLEWIRLPFGLKNCPPAFQRYINQMLGDLKGVICEPYLDDILTHSVTFEEHVQDLKKVLLRLLARGVKLRASKCEFAKREVRYLGRLVSGEGYRPDPAETAALDKFRDPPKTVGELRSLLGFLGYYRTYVQGFASRVKPLYDLLKGDGKDEKEKSGKKAGQCYDSRRKIMWNADVQRVLDELLDYLKSPQVMAYPDWNLPFFMTCDASGYGLGSVLYQTQKGVDRVVGYASRTLSDAEKKYHFHSGKLEFLALKWSITERYADYLRFGPPFLVYTDNNPLTYVLTSAKLNAVALRWVNDLADYQFTIKYRAGKSNTDADYLSRRPLNLEELKQFCKETLDPSCLDAVLRNAKGDVLADVRHVSVSQLTLDDQTPTVAIPRDEIIWEQKLDEVIAPVYAAVQCQIRPKRRGWAQLSPSSRILMQNFGRLKLIDGVLTRVTKQQNQVVLPLKYRPVVYRELHEKMAHLGADRVLELARQRFFWPRMGRDVNNFVRKKCRCVADKRPNVPERAKLVPIETSYPFEVVAIDFIHLDRCKGGFEYVLVVTDLFTKFVQMYGTRKKSSKAAAAKIFQEFILSFGFPKRIMHDMGGEFNSDLFRELHRLTGIEASNTTPYHPMANGQCERMNRSLVSMLKSLSASEKKDWKSALPKLSFAYNSTQHASTGFSPFFMTFGRESRLPIDDLFQEVQTESEGKLRCKSHQQFVDEWKASMKEAFRVAKARNVKAQEYNKSQYDGKVKEVGIEIGDQVLVKNLRETGGTGKLRSHWERQIFNVIKQQGELPVYHVQNINNAKDVRILHRNHLLKCEQLPLDVFDEEDSNLEKKPKGRNVKKAKKKVECETPAQPAAPSQLCDVEDADSEEDDIRIAVYHDLSDDQPREVLDPVVTVQEDELVEVPEEAEAVDEEIPVEEETMGGDSEPEAEGDEPGVESEETSSDSEAENTVRRSTRSRVPRKIMTYDDIGGVPSWEVVEN